jgi:hypothetical protein
MTLRAPLCNLGVGILLAWLSATAGAATDSPSADALPVTVSAKPRVVWKGSPVTLSGETVGGTGTSGVSVTIQPPGAQLASDRTLHASVDIAGQYSAQFVDTQKTGEYRVKATAPDGEGTAETRFKVTDAATASQDVNAAMTDALTHETEIEAALDSGLQNLPSSPAKDQARGRLSELRAQTAQLQQLTPRVVDAIVTVLKAGDLVTEPKFQARRAELVSSIDVLKTHPDAKVMLAKLQARRTTCDDLFNLIGGPTAIAQNYENDLLGYAAGKATQPGGETAAFGAGEIGKNANTLTQTFLEMNKKMRLSGKVLTTFQSLASSSASIASDLSGFAAGKAMGAYCEQFTGPMKAHMKAQFFKNDVKWWEYEFDLVGSVTVHYPKSASGDTIAVKGHMEGNGTNFKVWENELHVLYPELMTSTIIKKVVIPVTMANETVTSLYATARDVEGSVVGAHLPGAFFFEVTGVITKDRLELVLGPARTDMNPSATVVALALAPLSLAIHPYVYKLPYKNAHFVLERGANTYDIPISTVGRVIRGKRHFENERGNVEAKGFYTVDLEMCNPSC